MTNRPAEGKSIPINQIVSKNIKMIREFRKLSLEALAQLTGVSKSMLAQIERGDVSPTITTMWKLANGLKIPVTELVSAPETIVDVVRGSEMTPLMESEGRFRNYPLFGYSSERPFEMYRIEMDAGCIMQAEAHPPNTEELVCVFDGTLYMSVHDECIQLAAGDALRFRADTRHTYTNQGDVPCAISMVIYYPGQKFAIDELTALKRFS